MNNYSSHKSARVYQDEKYTIIVADDGSGDGIARYKDGVLTKFESKNN